MTRLLLKLTSHTILCAATQQSNMTRRRGFIAYKTPQNWRGKTERADLYIITLTGRQTTDDESIFQLQAPSFSGAIHTTLLKTQALRSRNKATPACKNIPTTANTQGATPWKGRMIVVCVDAQLRNCATDVECGASHLQPIVLQQ